MAAITKWRTWRLGALLFVIILHFVTGYEEDYSISQLSPKSNIDSRLPEDAVLKTSQTENLAFRIEPSVLFKDPDFVEDIIEETEEAREDRHFIVARSADPFDSIARESRSINVDEIPSSNNEIDNELELHHKRKYYDIHPTKTRDFFRSNDEVILSSSYGDRLEFRFPGEGKRVPYGRALSMGPRIRPSAVQPIFATATPRDEGRQNTEIQNIITGIVKLLNGNVNVQANTQLLGRPSRPMASRINNRGPPRISDVPPLPDFDKPLAPLPPHLFIPTKTPPPYPFDRPPVHVNLPEQIVPPLAPRPSLHRPMPPWKRPRPPNRPNRRPNPGLPMYKPNLSIIPYDIPEIDDGKPEEVSAVENETVHSENVIHHEEVSPTPEAITEAETEAAETTTTSSTTASTTTTTEATSPKPTTERTTTTTQPPVKTTTETKTEKPIKLEKEKKKESPMIEKEKPKDTLKEEKTTKANKVEVTTENAVKKPTETNKTPEVKVEIQTNKSDSIEKMPQSNMVIHSQNKTLIEQIIEPSLPEPPVTTQHSIVPTPIEGLVAPVPVVDSNVKIEVSSINTQPLPSQDIPYQPYRPRPGIVLDDPDFKPHGSRYRPEASVITALPPERLPGYGEIFDVTVSAIQGPGEKGGASVHIETVNLSGHEEDIIVSASGDQGFVSIDGKRTYLNLFDTPTPTASIAPTRVHSVQHNSAPPLPPPSQGPVGQGVAIPADDVPALPAPPPAPARRPQAPHVQGHRPHGHPGPHTHTQGPHRPHQGFKRPQPTVRIDTCIVGDDSTCDQAHDEKCRTEAGVSSCACGAGLARRGARDPCRRVVALLLSLRVDRLYGTKVAWDAKLADRESEPFQQLSYEAVRAIDSAFSMTPFSDDFVTSSVNALHQGDENYRGVYLNCTILMLETAETLSPQIAPEIQKHLLGVIRRRSNNVGASALWLDSVAGAVLPLHDVDECASPDLNDCHKLALCTNTWGGFKCTCPDTTLDTHAGQAGQAGQAAQAGQAGRACAACPATHCSERGTCRYARGQPYCSCVSGYYGSRCEVDGEVVWVAAGASLAAALVIALTLAALLSWSRKWSREQKAGPGSPVFSYMAAGTVKAPPAGAPPPAYQLSLEDRLRWAHIAEAMVANHYAQPEQQTMVTRPSSAMFGGYPTLPPVPLPRMGLHGHHNGTLNTVASRVNTSTSHHNLYGYSQQAACESTSSEASSLRAQDRADLLVPRPRPRPESRARSLHNQTGIYYDVEYENAPEPIYGAKGIPLSTYTVSRGPPFYR